MVAAGAVIEHQKTGKILLLQRAESLDWQAGSWEIDYGRLDQFEDPIVGLKRELKEETGITDLHIGKTLRVWHIFRGPETAENELIGITYHCTTTTDAVTLSAEHQDYRWVDVEEALALIKVEGIKQDIQAFQATKHALAQSIGRQVIGVGAGALIFDSRNRLLLSLRGAGAKNEAGKWEIPGGAIEFGETIEDGLKREVEEELAIKIKVGEMLQLCNHILPDEGQHWVSPTYLCEIVAGTPTIQEPEKCEKIGWFTVAEAELLPLAQVTRQDIEILKSRQNHTFT